LSNHHARVERRGPRITALPDENAADRIQFATVWEDGYEVPAIFVNELMLKPMPGPDGSLEGVAILFGMVEGPNLTGTDEEQRAAAKDVSHLPVQVRAKVMIGSSRVRTFADALASFADRIEGKS